MYFRIFQSLLYRYSYPYILIHTITHLPPSPKGGVEVAEEVTKLYAEEEGLRAEDALPLNLELCRSYLLVLASGSEWEKALEIFWKLVAVGGRGKGYQKLPELDAGCCEATLVACRRAGKWREALQVFRHVRREDVEVELTSAMYTSTVMTLLLVSMTLLLYQEEFVVTVGWPTCRKRGKGVNRCVVVIFSEM